MSYELFLLGFSFLNSRKLIQSSEMVWNQFWELLSRKLSGCNVILVQLQCPVLEFVVHLRLLCARSLEVQLLLQSFSGTWDLNSILQKFQERWRLSIDFGILLSLWI